MKWLFLILVIMILPSVISQASLAFDNSKVPRVEIGVDEFANCFNCTINNTFLNETTIIQSDVVGVIKMYAGGSAPSGWLITQGQIVSKSNYSDLCNVVGSTYGLNNATDCQLPDFRTRFPLGVGTTSLGQTGGTFNHTHNTDIPQFNSAVNNPAQVVVGLVGLTTTAVQDHIHPVNPPATNSNSNNPPYLTINFIIKT